MHHPYPPRPGTQEDLTTILTALASIVQDLTSITRNVLTVVMILVVWTLLGT